MAPVAPQAATKAQCIFCCWLHKKSAFAKARADREKLNQQNMIAFDQYRSKAWAVRLMAFPPGNR